MNADFETAETAAAEGYADLIRAGDANPTGNPVIREIRSRESTRESVAAILGIAPYGPIGFRITERVLNAAGV